MAAALKPGRAWAERGRSRVRTRASQQRRACVGWERGAITSIPEEATPRLFQVFAFITSLLYILHAFSIYYH